MYEDLNSAQNGSSLSFQVVGISRIFSLLRQGCIARMHGISGAYTCQSYAVLHIIHLHIGTLVSWTLTPNFMYHKLK